MDPMEFDLTMNELPKRRKLKHPRATRACLFCKKRKARCSGTLPCETCVREEVECNYALGRAPSVANPSPSTNTNGSGGGVRQSTSISSATPSAPPRSQRDSPDHPVTFADGRHVDPSSGVSFLYHSWNNVPEGASKSHSETEESLASSATLTTYGDFRQNPIDTNELARVTLTADQIPGLLEIYFRFATPTYRYMHQPSLENWTRIYVQDRGRLKVTQEACVLLVCAQALLYTQSGDRYVTGGDEDIYMSRCFYEKAKILLDGEMGSPSVTSVQARLAMCLYLLSTFRMNECRFAFSFAATIITSLGLHRKQSTTASKFGVLEREVRRRAFWSAYTLDGYLSVMLGRPRLFRDDDIDQPYPLNISDTDLVITEGMDLMDLPLHGNLEAFISHIEIAKLTGRNNDLLYPLCPLTEDLILSRTNEMLDAVDLWASSLPGFLKPRDATLTGQRTFERQNTVLKLASAHLRILITRRCLQTDFSNLDRTTTETSYDSRATRPLKECFAAIKSVIDTLQSLIETASLHQSYWFTQYIAIVAISTLYIFRVQGVSRQLAAYAEIHFNLEGYFQKAKDCQRYLSALAPEGSQAKRHYILLERLRSKARSRQGPNPQRSAPTASRLPNAAPNPPGQSSSTTSSDSRQAWQDSMTARAGSSQPMPTDTNFMPAHFSLPLTSPNSNVAPSIFSGAFTTPSETDFEFAAALNLGWESLDTVGFLSNDGGYDFSMM